VSPEQKRRWHATLARRLIAACGGLEEAAQECRVQKSVLGDYQSPHTDAFMPADVMADLEAYCGEALYSRALAEALPASGATRALTEEVCDVVESAADLQRRVRLAVKDGTINPRERADLLRAYADTLDELGQVGAQLAGEP
jgi:hypothetical protein